MDDDSRRCAPREGLIAKQRNAATITDRAGPERATCKFSLFLVLLSGLMENASWDTRAEF